MLFKFKSKACADLIMLEADARRILQAMTGDDPVKGIVRANDLLTAVARLEAAVAQDEALRQQRTEKAAAREPGQGPETQEHEAPLPPIRLAQRAAPMLQMLRRCAAQESDLVWGV